MLADTRVTRWLTNACFDFSEDVHDKASRSLVVTTTLWGDIFQHSNQQGTVTAYRARCDVHELQSFLSLPGQPAEGGESAASVVQVLHPVTVSCRYAMAGARHLVSVRVADDIVDVRLSYTDMVLLRRVVEGYQALLGATHASPATESDNDPTPAPAPATRAVDTEVLYPAGNPLSLTVIPFGKAVAVTAAMLELKRSAMVGEAGAQLEMDMASGAHKVCHASPARETILARLSHMNKTTCNPPQDALELDLWPGDILVAIDGVSVESMGSVEKVARALVSASAPTRLKIRRFAVSVQVPVHCIACEATSSVDV